MKVLASVLAPLLARHLASYLELGAAAAAEWRGAWMRRLCLLMVGMVAAFAGIAALWAVGLVAVWETQWRVPYAAASALVLLLVACLALRAAATRGTAGPSSGALKSELLKDVELFRQWKATL